MATTAKTPTVAIARVLRSFGLVQGEDFRVTAYRSKGERVGTYVVVISDSAQQVIANNADAIESMVGEIGFSFHVSIYRGPGGRMWTGVANYGIRTRENAPAEVEVPAEAPTETPTEAEINGVMNGTELARAVANVAVELPAGTRVVGRDTADQDRVGTVYRGDDGVVDTVGHPNYGRTYVGVMWDDDFELSIRINRSRPFVDSLYKLGTGR